LYPLNRRISVLVRDADGALEFGVIDVRVPLNHTKGRAK
jgi:hypothetical protein